MLTAKDLSIGYNDKQPLFKDLSFEVKDGESLAVYGKNGSGKTTLLDALSSLIPQKIKANIKGEIRIDNKNINSLKREEIITSVGYIMSNLFENMALNNVTDELVFTLENLAFERDETEKRLNMILEVLNIEDLRNKKIRDLSSGQKALVGIASVLIVNPSIILCDEIFRHLDKSYKEKVIDVLKKFKESGHIIIIVDQDRDIIGRCDKKICLDGYRGGLDDRD